MFSCAYLAQGIHLAIATILVPIYLLDKNFPPEYAAFIAGIVMIPWIIKFIFGWIADHYSKFGRKKFSLYGGLSSAFFLLILAFIDPSLYLIYFILTLIFIHCGVGFLDVSIDAWAIETTVEQERGKINGAMTASFFTGMALGSSFLGQVAKNISYSNAFIVASLCIFILLLPLLLAKEKRKIKRHHGIGQILKHEFTKKKTQIMIIFLPLISINSGIITFAVPFFMNMNLHLDIGQIGLITTISIIGRVAGSLIGGLSTDKWGRKRTLIFIIITTIIFSALLIYVNSWQIIAILYGILGLLNGALFTNLFAICMDITAPEVGATQFSILMSLLNFGELGGESMSGILISQLGFGRTFLYAAWILGSGLLILRFIRLKPTK